MPPPIFVGMSPSTIMTTIETRRTIAYGASLWRRDTFSRLMRATLATPSIWETATRIRIQSRMCPASTETGGKKKPRTTSQPMAIVMRTGISRFMLAGHHPSGEAVNVRLLENHPDQDQRHDGRFHDVGGLERADQARLARQVRGGS